MRKHFVTIAAVAALVSTSCSGGGGGDPDLASAERSTTSAPANTSTSAPTTTTSTTTSTTVPPDGLAPGMQGAQVQALQEALAAQKFDIGTIDGQYGGLTSQAVMAFQKWHGLERTGRATQDVLDKLASAAPPSPLMAGAEPTRVEFDKRRQVLLVIVGGSLRAVLNASSGSGRPYCENGYCGDARTPDGAYRITRRISGWRVSPLGRLYNPLYFNGGIAIHGSGSVPAYPASHGCVRISMSAAEWLPSVLPNGTPVYVIGDRVPSPLNRTGATPTTQPEPTTTAPPATSATSTTTPSSSTTVAPTTTSTTAPSSTTTTASATP